ncbi:alpha/beta fold hydrolase [Pseudochryseolinea flava]|uniref:AB hydrolase-1 domain-containing protein n=1 Tax=Pseudochryseolinea flava TaxID=2059302 RepID=A0A364XV59_9BACT|nr:alpha/beta hydrolase [Pseudochryseolinea flava]RAV98165.1 hypothetical protein DQQ10_25195 [Pseudochryseolinea flava]
MSRHIIAIIAFLFTTSQQVNAQTPATVAVTGKGKPVLFLPHIGCSPDMWNEVVSEISKTHECHVFSFAGFAKAQPLKENYTAQYLTYIAQYITDKKLKDVTLVGMNYGGFISLQLGTTLHVKKIVVIDTYPFLSQVLNPDVTLTEAAAYASQAKSSYLAPTDSAFHAVMYQTGKAMITNDSVNAKRYAEWNVQSDRKTIAEVLADQMKTDLRPALANIKIPVLIIGTWYFGKTYKKLPIEEGYRMHETFYKTLTNRTIKLTETAKDFMQWDEPQWFLNEVKHFLAK